MDRTGLERSVILLVGMIAMSCASTGGRTQVVTSTTEGKMKLDNTRLLVARFDETFRFYRDIMGFKVTWGKEGDVYAHFEAPGGGEIALFKRSLMAEAIGTASRASSVEAQDRFSLVIKVPDVDALVERLRQQGIPIVSPPADRKDWGIRAAHLRDPDGNLIELMSDLPQKE